MIGRAGERYPLTQPLAPPPSSARTKSRFARKPIPNNIIPSRRVRFCEERNTIHESPHENLTECKKLWYQAADFHAFKKMNVSYAHFLLRQEKRNNDRVSWFAMLRQDYKQCLHVMNQEDLLALLEASSDRERAFLPGYVGMNHLVISVLHKDRLRRRAWVHNAVHYWQNSLHLQHDDDTKRAEMICKASCEISRPSRLFAHHTARLQLTSPSPET